MTETAIDMLLIEKYKRIQRINYFTVERCQRGWRSTCCFDVTVSTQFSDMSFSVTGSSRFMLFAIFRSWLVARQLAKNCGATNQQRRDCGWA